MIKNRMFYDTGKCPRAIYSPPHEMLGWYLEQEVQSSLATCDELKSICEDILSGTKEKWEGVGNAHYILIEGKEVTIENEFDENAQPCITTIENFQEALQQWKDLIVII